MILPAGCSWQHYNLQPLSDDAVILAFGDSLTYGAGAPRTDSYPAVLARLTGRQVINAGKPGEISAAGVQRLPGVLDRDRPDLLLLCHGGNDMLRELDPGATRANLAAMIESAEQRGIPVILIGVPAPGPFQPGPAAMYDDLAARYGLVYERNTLPVVETDGQLKSDRVHPNAAGYRQIARALYRLLQQNGALRRE